MDRAHSIIIESAPLTAHRSDHAPDLVRVLERLTEARHHPARWSDFLHDLALATGASSAVLLALSGRSRGEIWMPWRLAEPVCDQWLSHFRHLDPWYLASRLPSRGEYRIMVGEDLVPDEQLRRSDYFDNFLRPNGIRWMRAAWFRPDAGHAPVFGVMLFRGVEQTSFSPAVTGALDVLMRQMQVDEGHAVANAMSRAAGMDGRESAVFLLSASGALVMCNERGSQLLDNGAVINGARCLSFANQAINLWLTALINQGGPDPSVFGNGARQRDKLSGLGAVTFELYPFHAIDAAVSLHGVRYALVIRPVQARGVPNLARAAQQMYGWTGAEVDTVRRLAAGDALPVIAQSRHCSLETVRSHIKNAKRKASVKRQVDLVRLMISLEG